MAQQKIAVLLATYNRREKTLSCLKSLDLQKLSPDVVLDVFMTDDASTDDTLIAVKKLYPGANIYQGGGSLFWAGGMRNSWTEAQKAKPDYYLLLNDDTVLNENALNTLLNYHDPENAICVGSTKDEISGIVSYGGQKLHNKRKIQSFNVYSDTDYVACDMANANIMLVPRKIVEQIGILSTSYTHSIADFDYSLRAAKAGFKVMVAPGTLGYCTDDHGKNWRSADTPLRDRIKYLKSVKGLAYSEYLYFIRRHFPLHLPAAFFKLWFKTLFPVMWDKFKS